MKFKQGDRVTVTEAATGPYAHMIGQSGTIVQAFLINRFAESKRFNYNVRFVDGQVLECNEEELV